MDREGVTRTLFVGRALWEEIGARPGHCPVPVEAENADVTKVHGMLEPWQWVVLDVPDPYAPFRMPLRDLLDQARPSAILWYNRLRFVT